MTSPVVMGDAISLFFLAGEKPCKRNHFSRSKPRMTPRQRRGSKTDQKLMGTRFIVIKGESNHAGPI
jgi:hypothetical protein